MVLILKMMLDAKFDLLRVDRTNNKCDKTSARTSSNYILTMDKWLCLEVGMVLIQK